MTPPSSYTEYKVVGGDGRLRMAGSPQIVSWPGTCVDQLAEPSLRNGRRFLRHAEIFSDATRRSEVEVIDANADEWLLAGASGITVSFRPAIPRQVAPQQSPLPLRRHAQCSVSAAIAKGAERKRSMWQLCT